MPETSNSPAPHDEPRDLGTLRGRKVWRSLDEAAGNDEFREFLDKEFPVSARELHDSSRRDFVKLMGAGVALAGGLAAAGCRRPEQTIMPYSKDVPQEIVPGEALYYATSMPLPGGGAEGLLVETHDGRPTKIEGNPLHPVNQGKSSMWSQALVLGLYYPDRLMQPMYRAPDQAKSEAKIATWDDFKLWCDNELFPAHEQDRGRGLAILADKRTSPSRAEALAKLTSRFPEARVMFYDAGDRDTRWRGTAMAFGEPARPVYRFEDANVILTLDADVVTEGPDALVNARELASARRVRTINDTVARLYAVESLPSPTGSKADHRLRLSPARIGAFAVALAQAILERRPGFATPDVVRAVRALDAKPGADIDQAFVDALADDLIDDANRGRSVIACGDDQPSEVHALVAMLNEWLGNHAVTVRYVPVDESVAASSARSIESLANAIRQGGVQTLICLDTNPVYDAPGAVGFADAFAAVPRTITLSVESTETAAASMWSLPAAHTLESWGDAQAYDGTLGVIQPMIDPIYGSWSQLDLLAMLAGFEGGGYALVQETWKSRLSGDFEKQWRRVLHDGLLPGSGVRPKALSPDQVEIARGLTSMRVPDAPVSGAPHAVVRTGKLYDGRFASNAWLQEIPSQATRVAWDNPALVSPATARAMNLMPESVDDPNRVYIKGTLPKAKKARVEVDGRSMELPVWICPGMPDHVVHVELGGGRSESGRVSEGVGFNTHAIKPVSGPGASSEATISRVGGRYAIASTQNHWSLEGRHTLVRQVDLPAWVKHGESFPKEHRDEVFPRTVAGKLTFAEMFGELSHTPPNISAYDNPYNEGPAGPDPDAIYAGRGQWGMSIDLSACTGCDVCTIACQAENNIPVVGKAEVAKGREMHWIRVDRYFVGDDLDNPDEFTHQPIGCVHCENAPCETVCPVNATVHDDQGLNLMAYNRCIGTRYCANNCPYKVRRFNFFDYATKQTKGEYLGKEIADIGNVNFVPPSIRKKVDQISQMANNPDVTVRERGVMEKCSYCIQRINVAKAETKLQDLEHIPAGWFQSACQQACPSDAISFGDINDPESRVHADRNHQRSYMLLGYLNTRPRTTHMLDIKNPNPALRMPEADPYPLGKHKGHGGGHGKDNHGSEHEGGHDGHGDGHGDGHASFFDPSKRDQDRGYARSLRVLGFEVNA